LEPKVSFEPSLPVFSKKNKLGLCYYYSFRRKSIVENADLFLIDEKSVGGMGLTQDVGIIYGTFGLISLTVGGIIAEL
jgi:PAT family beta-lactamase induction signal transducer AmpG